MPLLRTYLSRIRSLVFSSNVGSTRIGHENSVLVLGNPSADLDSFISAVTTSYFYNLKSSNSKHAKQKTYIPILNLPTVKATELWRLRPEFGVAIRLALGDSADVINQAKAGEQGKTAVLEDLITIADIKADSNSSLYPLFTESSDSESESSSPSLSQSNKDAEKQPLFLVDHNAPSIPGLSDKLISTRFTVASCIDHHVDENYVPKDAAPRIITTGIGSCTSLVIKHLRDEALWPPRTPETASSSSSQVQPQALQQISKLALAPILIDTANLKASGDKCSDTDREAVKFLESAIITHHHTGGPPPPPPSPGVKVQAASSSSSSTPQEWHRDAFHSAISTAKSNSLDLLSMQEIFDRDYKVWTERTSTGPGPGRDVNIGISSLVRPLSWLAKHAGGIDEFLAEIESFARSPDRNLGVFGMLTRTGDGRKEVVVLAFDDAVVNGLVDEFERQSRSGEMQLQLRPWEGDETLARSLEQRFGRTGGECKIWYMGDTSKSRKQVGPLLRQAVRGM
jgi:exopolyphosphatase